MEHQTLYDKYAEERHWEQHPIIYAERFIQFLKKKKWKGLILDIGCGTGRDVNYFHQQEFQVKGIDYDPKEIQQAKEKYPQCQFEIQNIENVKYNNESIGACFMINVIHYVDPKKALGEIYKMLKKGGYVFIHWNLKIVDVNGNIDYEQGEKEIYALLRDFKLIKKNIYERVDTIPHEHTHTILELLMQK